MATTPTEKTVEASRMLRVLAEKAVKNALQELRTKLGGKEKIASWREGEISLKKEPVAKTSMELFVAKVVVTYTLH